MRAAAAAMRGQAPVTGQTHHGRWAGQTMRRRLQTGAHQAHRPARVLTALERPSGSSGALAAKSCGPQRARPLQRAAACAAAPGSFLGLPEVPLRVLMLKHVARYRACNMLKLLALLSTALCTSCCDDHCPFLAEGAEGRQSSTVRLVRGPGGRMVDARKLAGWVTAPDGRQMPCPRCEGEAFIRLNGVRVLQHDALADMLLGPKRAQWRCKG